MENRPGQPIPQNTPTVIDGADSAAPSPAGHLASYSQLAQVNQVAQEVLGIEVALLTEFLTLLRDRYPLADKASYFLETHQGVSAINIAITNQRDALSHLVSLLLHPEWPPDKQRQQIANAEEHLRRAAMEPYDVAVADELQKVVDLRKDYRKYVVPRLSDSRFSTALTIEKLDVRLNAIQKKRIKARGAKSENAWDVEWEEGLRDFVSAFEDAHQLHQEIESLVDRARQIQATEEQTTAVNQQAQRSHGDRRLTWVHILVVVLFGIGLLLGKAAA